MWLGIIVILGIGIYLAWSLVKGKIFFTSGTDLRRQTRLINREDQPTTFWVAWGSSAIALIIATVYLIRTALS